MRLDPSTLTERQQAVLKFANFHWPVARIAEETGLDVASVRGALAEIRLLENHGRRTAREKAVAAAKIDARLGLNGPCGKCGLRGKHVCTTIYSYASERRTA